MRAAALMGDTPWLERRTDAASPGSARPATPEPAEEFAEGEEGEPDWPEPPPPTERERNADRATLGAALRGANHKFERRFRAMEAQADAQGEALAAMDLEAQEALWQQAKAAEKA